MAVAVAVPVAGGAAVVLDDERDRPALGLDGARTVRLAEIGRASCRERV